MPALYVPFVIEEGPPAHRGHDGTLSTNRSIGRQVL